MYDPAFVHQLSADETGASNGIVPKHGRIKVHKVVVYNGASGAQLTVLVYDATSITGTPVIAVQVPVVATGTVFGSYAESNFDPPVPLEVGLSVDIGNPGAVLIYYTPG